MQLVEKGSNTAILKAHKKRLDELEREGKNIFPWDRISKIWLRLLMIFWSACTVIGYELNVEQKLR